MFRCPSNTRPLARRHPAPIAGFAASFVLVSAAFATDTLFSSGWSNETTVSSHLCGTPSVFTEAADDFDLEATIERIYVNGDNPCIATCVPPPPPVTGVRVRFYEWTENGPGVLQSEQFVAAGDPGFLYDPTNIEDLDIALPTPFEATGKHYFSVQIEFAECFGWAYWVANPNAPMFGPAYRRTSRGEWALVTAFEMESSDLSFSLIGTQGPPDPTGGCGTWFVQPSPHPTGMDDSWLNDMAYLAPDDIWAVGRSFGEFQVGDFNQNTLAMHYDGTSWSIVPTPNPAPIPLMINCELNAVAALSPTNVWAAGTRIDSDGGPGWIGLHNLVLHWDGTSWEHIDAPIPPTFGAQGVSGDGIYDILALAEDDIWFFGEWITLNAQGFTFRYALAMHYDGADFTVHPMPLVGSNGATIYGSDAASSDDIWAAGAAGDGDAGTMNFSFIYHWDGSAWEHRPFTPAPGLYHWYGDVKVLTSDDVWISGLAWAPGEMTPFMLHWDGDDYEYVEVPFAGGSIVGEPPAMYVFGNGGVSVFDGVNWSDAELHDGLGFLTGFGFGAVTEIGECAMLAVGFKNVAGDARTLVAQLAPLGSAAGVVQPDIDGDGDVDGADLGLLLGSWGSSDSWADLDANGTVDGGDLGMLLGAWTG